MIVRYWHYSTEWCFENSLRHLTIDVLDSIELYTKKLEVMSEKWRGLNGILQMTYKNKVISHKLSRRKLQKENTMICTCDMIFFFHNSLALTSSTNQVEGMGTNSSEQTIVPLYRDIRLYLTKHYHNLHKNV